MELSEKSRLLETHDSTTDTPFLVIDFENKAQLPPEFRSTQDPYKRASENAPTRYGLDSLKASACRQFSELDLKTTLQRISGDIYIVDLRQEPHGFIDGAPISWYGLRNQTYAGESPEAIETLEQEFLAEVAAAGTVKAHEIVNKINGRISETLAQHLPVNRVETERELVQRLGLKYQRFFVTDHRHPNDQCIDQFVNFVRDLPGDAWLHFHCRSGFGRTSTFMVLHDIIRNSSAVSLEDIILRHSLVGSKNLFQVADSPDKLWRYDMGADRREFIKEFYDYMRGPGAAPGSSWAEWNARRNLV